MSRLHTFTRLASAAALAAVLITSIPAFAQDTCDPTVDHYRAGSDAYAAGNYSAAYASFGCFTRLYPLEVYAQQNAEAFNMRGNALRAQGDYAGSIAEYTLAIAAQNDFAIAYNNRGWSYFNLEDYDNALADFNSAINYDPNLAYAYNNRGLVYQLRGDLRQAPKHWRWTRTTVRRSTCAGVPTSRSITSMRRWAISSGWWRWRKRAHRIQVVSMLTGSARLLMPRSVTSPLPAPTWTAPRRSTRRTSTT